MKLSKIHYSKQNKIYTTKHEFQKNQMGHLHINWKIIKKPQLTAPWHKFKKRSPAQKQKYFSTQTRNRRRIN